MKENALIKVLSVIQENSVSTVIGIIGSTIAALFGGWDVALTTLIIFMAIDYISGLVVAKLGKSLKSPNGGLDSRTGFKGLMRKGMILVMVLVAALLDKVIGTSFVRDAVVIAYLANEAISITENAGLMGVPINPAITKSIDILKNKSKEAQEK
ncbi:phage holin family protein [Scatolibacter rhodanostii]|uniref:phage holin family protein n=1 Tax=Scatolibacter rhodanostii TaxID=2014781 RepID=UPI000C068710|nr:phage holin family protein [Scatolibacter rhodanostii]